MLPTSFFSRHGVQHPLGAGFSGAQDHLPQLLDEQTALSAVARVPASVMREVFLNGTPDEVVDQAAESAVPFTKVLSGLKKL
jgi:phthiodiolone/phenolphthiodiolone dimycocerosates ketoreductase